LKGEKTKWHSLLQAHPLEKVGRAQTLLANSSPDDLELTYAFLECARIKELYSGKLQIQFDVADRELVRDDPCKVYAGETGIENYSESWLADLVSTLIVENDGFVVPVQYGLSREYGLGNLKDDSFKNHAVRWKNDVYPSFRKLCRRVFHQMIDDEHCDLPFTNWYGMIMQSCYTSDSFEKALV